MIDFKQLALQVSRNIEGFIYDDEFCELFDLAKDSISSIVEIGSYKGKSTIALAYGSLDGTNGNVYTIDHHKGDIFIGKQDSYKQFIKNMDNAFILDYITPILDTSENASKTFTDDIGLLFIDGNHEYESIKTDFKCWYHRVLPNGIIAFHDYSDKKWKDVKKFVDELMSKKEYNIKFIKLVNRLYIIQKE